jgi:hypothetical protein
MSRGVDELRVDELRVDELRVDELRVDELRVKEPRVAGGRAGLQAGVRAKNKEGFSPRGGRARGLKASSRSSGRGPEGPLFHP